MIYNKYMDTSSPKILTVVVMDENNQPAEGATVTMQPTGGIGITNAQGEAQMKLGRALKYDVTVKVDGASVTVPYYVTKNGATRLVVNPTYLKIVAQEASPLARFDILNYSTIGIGLGIILILLVVWKLFSRRRR